MAKKPPAKRSPAKAPMRAPAKKSSSRPAGLFTWIAVGVVVVVVAALVIIKVVSGSPTTLQNSTFQPTDPATVTALTTIPASVFNTVGITSPVAPVTPPIVLKNQPPLTATSASGKVLPEVFYLGAEYCPFCAAQRWPTIIALSRFGTWSGLGNTTSSSIDYAPNTPTFTFYKAKFSSPYLVFKSIEETTNVYDSALGNYTKLQTPSKAQQAVFTKYDTPKYVPGMTAADAGSIPFITLGNKLLVSGASYGPLTLSGLSRTSIANALNDTTSPVTDAIIASANYLTASLCTLTGQQPAAVCTSSGVQLAKKAMKL